MTVDASTHYVPTKVGKQIVVGNEVKILGALGINWNTDRRGHSHITCPYPTHGGVDDWRWDEKKAKAYCTCQNGKADSIFDVVSKIKGLNFEGAKIRCAEILGENDLIHPKATSGLRGEFQLTDARSLLNAPAERRDDRLPANYLGHRLGIDADAVLMPNTPAVGFVALAYFDPPKENGSKPVKVGDFPCAVFETQDAAGGTHAHRIYLAAGGAGKAELGATAGGKPRDPKKSAKHIGDDSTAGRSVLWGDPAVATWCIVSEGIETAAAVAQAFRPEIERGEVLVVSAINAGGIEAFKPWPATKRVTIAADRDEEVKEGKAISTRRGENAARTFGARNCGRLSVAIALPGPPDSTTDWLDVYAKQGGEAVRTGILTAVRYTATSEEVFAEPKRVGGDDELRRIKADYPLPEMDTLSLEYRRSAIGKIRVHRLITVGDDTVLEPICSPFGVLARLRFVDQGNVYGLRVVVEGLNGQRRKLDIERAGFATQGATETRAMLLAVGLVIVAEDGERVAVRCLKAAEPTDEIAVVRAPGWHTLDGVDGQFFVCPSGKVVGAEDGVALELSAASCISERVAAGGTFDGWKAAVAAAAGIAGCPHWTLGAMAGFAAPLVALSGLATCGINLSGRTSGGKTTTQRLAVSAWSRAALDQPDSLLQTARATANGVEAMAARSNATILALDELGHVDGKELKNIIYSLASGVGKSRMNANVEFRNSRTWSTFILLSAEKSMEEKVRAEGGGWTGGMTARIPDVDITGVDRNVPPAALTQVHSVDQHFGHAGPAFVEALIANGVHNQVTELRAGIMNAANVLAGEGADSSLVRAALPFAILTFAGNLAKKFEILPDVVDVAGTVRWAWAKFLARLIHQAVADGGFWADG
ncbi:DUF927 domain-containing protein, partial [Methylobacterium sp. BTF04]|uniref:DUF927 domain-containing protein n=1 Tax=Methylobacterium sp. BTF04 TaxID=2708300 RepID=UPI0013D06BF1